MPRWFPPGPRPMWPHRSPRTFDASAGSPSRNGVMIRGAGILACPTGTRLMHSIDWVLVAATLAIVLGFALYTQRFVKSVADFLAAGRCAGRYLLANARGESDSGLANTMSKFEQV